MIKISHEIPLALLKESRNFNDYCYCLCHLYDEIPEYKEFYLESVKGNRHVLLDNSIFELGTAFDPDEYARIIEELRPTEYIVPDVTDDADATIESFENWKKNYAADLPGRMMGVVQGKDYETMKKCLEYLSSTVFRIAFNFHGCHYTKMGNGDSKYQKMMDGRCKFLNKLDSELALPYNKSYHLLGVSLPQEYIHAKKFKYVKKMFTSLDTSNPIVHGLRDIKYNELEGLPTKESIKLADLINVKPTKKQKNLIDYNVEQFRNIVKNSAYANVSEIYESENSD